MMIVLGGMSMVVLVVALIVMVVLIISCCIVAKDYEYDEDEQDLTDRLNAMFQDEAEKKREQRHEKKGK